MVWINCGAFPSVTGRVTSDGSIKPLENPTILDEDRKAKVTALRLMVAFVVATKHHVRAEYGLDWEDLRSLLPGKFFEHAKT